jgi:glyoxylase-like metal-dependent hydrolase (beta-lactamase superfamily II)
MKTAIPSLCLPSGLLALSLATGPHAAAAQEGVGAETRPVKLAENVYLLEGLDCNVLAAAGPEGVVIVDNGSSGKSQSLKAQIASLESGPARVAINTHYHFDHVGSNEALGKSGATIVAHENTRRLMEREWRTPEALGVRYPVVPPYPGSALPTVTFERSLKIRLNGWNTELIFLPRAHSGADVIVFLRDQDVLHMGDLYLSNGFPILDSFNGGTIDGLLAALDAVIALAGDHTKVVPGHGSVSNRQGVRTYREMLARGRDRIAALVKKGSTLEDAVAADPLKGLYPGESWLPPKVFIWTVYVDLTRRR